MAAGSLRTFCLRSDRFSRAQAVAVYPFLKGDIAIVAATRVALLLIVELSRCTKEVRHHIARDLFADDRTLLI